MRTTLLLICILMLSSCAPDSHNVAQCVTSEPAGFWSGLWHGIIAPITFIVSLFSDSVAIYEGKQYRRLV